MNEVELIKTIQEYRRYKYKKYKELSEKGWDDKAMKEFNKQWNDILFACFNLEMHLDDCTF
jgi:hypothetical protein